MEVQRCSSAQECEQPHPTDWHWTVSEMVRSSPDRSVCTLFSEGPDLSETQPLPNRCLIGGTHRPRRSYPGQGT
eukprot:2908839-Amphidinium_carterae.1